MFQQGSPYRRKIAQNIPICEWYQAEDYVRNEFGISVYKAANSYEPKGVVAEKYYWVDVQKNHIPFFLSEIQIGIGAPTDPASSEGPFIYLDSSSGAIYAWENTTNTWVMVSGGSLNIYNSNGTLTSNRTLNGAGLNLTFSNLTKFTTAGVFGLSSLPNTLNTNTSILTRNSITGEVEIRTADSLDTNFAKNDLTFTGNRNHDLANFDLVFNNADEIALDTNRTVINAVTDVTINSNAIILSVIPVLNNTAAKLLTRNTLTGNIEEREVSSISTGGGTQTLSTTPAISNVDITISGGNTISLLPATNLLAGLMVPSQFNKLSFISITQSVDLDLLEAYVTNLNTLTGVLPTDWNLGTFTGTTIPDNTSVKIALQSLETSLETKQNKLIWQDNGIDIAAAGVITTIDIIGGGVATAYSAGKLTINIAGSAGSDLIIQDEGVAVNSGGDLTKIDFVGDLVKATFLTNTATVKLPNLGNNLQMTGGDPNNNLNVVIGELVTNHVETTSTGKIIDLSIPNFADTWVGATGVGKSSVILFKGTSPTIWTSLLGGSEGKWVKIINLSNTLLLLENDSTSGTPSARFINSTGRATPILANQSVDLIYTSGKWYMSNLPTYDAFDDFIGVPTGIGGGTWLTSNHSLGSPLGGNWSLGINGSRQGVATIEITSPNRGWIGESTSNKSHPNSIGLFYFDRFNLATSATITQRYSRGVNRAGANYNKWVDTVAGTAGIEGGSLVYYPDSGATNATTNWFYYVGTGVLSDYLANAVDSGITVASTQTTPQNLIVYANFTNFDVTFITSENNRDYTIRTTINRGVPLGTATASLIHSRVSGSGGVPGLDWLCIHNAIKIYR